MVLRPLSSSATCSSGTWTPAAGCRSSACVSLWERDKSKWSFISELEGHGTPEAAWRRQCNTSMFPSLLVESALFSAHVVVRFGLSPQKTKHQIPPLSVSARTTPITAGYSIHSKSISHSCYKDMHHSTRHFSIKPRLSRCTVVSRITHLKQWVKRASDVCVCFFYGCHTLLADCTLWIQLDKHLHTQHGNRFRCAVFLWLVIAFAYKHRAITANLFSLFVYLFILSDSNCMCVHLAGDYYCVSFCFCLRMSAKEMCSHSLPAWV